MRRSARQTVRLALAAASVALLVLAALGAPVRLGAGATPAGILFASAILVGLGAIYVALTHVETGAEGIAARTGRRATSATPLDALDAVGLDLETTGTDPGRARIVAVGAVRVCGTRVYPRLRFECLVDPGVPIPPQATAVHGIDDAAVRGAPAVADVIDELAAIVRGAVLVGHHIGFDLAVLAAEARRAGADWTAPPALCTAALAAALDPRIPDLSLECVAARHGVPVEGRHTALGDAVTAAHIFARMVPLLRERGVRTLGDALGLIAAPPHGTVRP